MSHIAKILGSLIRIYFLISHAGNYGIVKAMKQITEPSKTMMRVLIIGGYGTFGFRIAQGLCDEAGLTLYLAGRNLEKARKACSRLSGQATFIPLKLDPNHLALDFKPCLIIDASGPFQSYNGSPVLDYCLDHGIDYADLSDDAQFVQDVKLAGKAAKATNIIAVSGLSTCPVLSAIGLREIEAEIGAPTHTMIGIAPSPKADLGRNVIGAVMSYAGQKSVPVRRDGKTEIISGLTEIRDATICVPGDRPLPRLPFAVADAPDAIVLPHSFRDLTDICTGAATRPVWLHCLLVILARGISRGALPIKKYLNNKAPVPGAYSGDEVIDLQDLEPEFAKLNIRYGLQYDGHDRPVYEASMGDAYQRLSPAVQDLHRSGAGRVVISKVHAMSRAGEIRCPVSWP